MDWLNAIREKCLSPPQLQPSSAQTNTLSQLAGRWQKQLSLETWYSWGKGKKKKNNQPPPPIITTTKKSLCFQNQDGPPGRGSKSYPGLTCRVWMGVISVHLARCQISSLKQSAAHIQLVPKSNAKNINIKAGPRGAALPGLVFPSAGFSCVRKGTSSQPAVSMPRNPNFWLWCLQGILWCLWMLEFTTLSAVVEGPVSINMKHVGITQIWCHYPFCPMCLKSVNEWENPWGELEHGMITTKI